MYFEGEKWLILSILSTKKHNLKNILILIIVETRRAVSYRTKVEKSVMRVVICVLCEKNNGSNFRK